MNLLNGITGLRKEPASDAENSQPGALDLLERGSGWGPGFGFAHIWGLVRLAIQCLH